MTRRLWAGTAALALLMALSAVSALAHPDGNAQQGHPRYPYDPVDGPYADNGDAKDQHGGTDGHLPASSSNVQLVGKIDTLTSVSGGIADVSAFGNYAYLNAFSPECLGRSGAQGTGVHVVDISNPAAPAKVGFLPAEPNSYVGEGIHVIRLNGKDLLLHNNETCDGSLPVTSGVSLWNVTNPLTPITLGQFGDTTPAVPNQTYHTTHSVQGFVWQGKAYAVAQDNQDLNDIDIFDITPVANGTGPAVLVSEVGIESWPSAQSPLANGDSVFHHDMQQKVINGHNYLLASYWDAGQVLLNIDNPATPVFVTDSDFSSPDLAGFAISEGNSHQSYWSTDGKYVISSDEDFSPTRTLCQIVTGPDAGPTACGEFGWTRPLPASAIQGPTVFGGSGCNSDLNGNGVSDRAEVPAATSTDQIVVFSRGGCFFSDKVATGEMAGYGAVVIGNSHGGSRGGLLANGFICGSQGSAVARTAYGACIGHKAMHLVFGDAPAYSAPEGYVAGGDLPAIGTLGETLSIQGGVFDGWGYLRLHDGATLQELDSYAIPEALDPAYADGFGNLTVHEVKTDPRPKVNLAYASYYDAGLRVLSFGPGGLQEVGHYIGEGGNDFWGTFPIIQGEGTKNLNTCGRGKDDQKRPLLLMSDRDSGLWIFRYTGDENCG